MRIAVYAIAKDEAPNVERFMASCRDADLVVVADTGSSDGTPELLRRRGAEVHEIEVSPWRFDAARNRAMALLPEDVDVCMAVDLDEVILPGWREALEAAWTPEADLGNCWYVCRWEDEAFAEPAVYEWRTRMHRRRGAVWRRRLHEGLYLADGREDARHIYIDGIEVHHLAQPSVYVEQLTECIAEDPGDAELYVCRAQDYVRTGEYEQALADYRTYLDMTEEEAATDPRFWAVRASVWTAIAAIYRRLDGVSPELILRAYLRAVAEDPFGREEWVSLAEAWAEVKNWPAAYGAAKTAESIVQPTHPAMAPAVWGDYPRQLAEQAWERLTKEKEEV